MKARERFTGVDLIKFNSWFQSDEDCYRYLSEIKWLSGMYYCKRCGNTIYGRGKKPPLRICAKCFNKFPEINWSSGEYCCKKCHKTKYINGKQPYSRRCKSCFYDESPTVGTMFEKCKISLLTAFQIIFKISISKNEVTSEELSKEFGLRQKTCWKFKQKVRQVMWDKQQGNIDEDFFRFSWRKKKGAIFDTLICRMVKFEKA